MLKMSIIKTTYKFIMSNYLFFSSYIYRYCTNKGCHYEKKYPYDAPILSTDNRIAIQMNIEYAKAKMPANLPRAERIVVEENIKQLLKENNAVLVAHYYVDPFIQDLALATGGCVGDSLEMARFGQAHSAQTLVVAGVRFMGESAKILSMERPSSCQI